MTAGGAAGKKAPLVKRGATVARRKPKQGSVLPATAVRGSHSQSEAAFQRSVESLLDLYGWKWHHEVDSRKSKRGLPDLIACRGERLLFAELKSAAGVLTKDQVDWLKKLCDVRAIEIYTWRPKDMDEVLKVLA